MVHHLTSSGAARCLSVLALCAVTLGGGGLHAQSGQRLEGTTAEFAQTAAAAPGGWNLRVPATALFGEVSTEDKRVTGSFSGFLSQRLNWTVTVSGPVDEDDAAAPVAVADLNGLRNAATGALTLTYRHWEPSADATAGRAFCRRYWGAHLPPAVAAANERVRLDESLTQDVRKQRMDVRIDSMAAANCQSLKLPPDVRNDFERASQIDYGRPLTLALQLEGGMNKFRYVNGTGEVVEESRRPFAVSGSVNYYVPNLRTLFAAGVRLEESHEGARAVEYCTPLTGGASQCRSLALSAPEQKNATIAQVEVRRFFTDFLGLSPRLSHDLRNDVTGVEVPILIRQRGDAGFQSGLIVGWRSDEDGVIVSAFVGRTFGLRASP